jgi:hypothetical protein
MLHQVENMVAAIGPAGVAFHTHHIVAAFHSTKESVAQPSIEMASRHEGEYCALISISGSKPTKRVMQLAPSHGSDKNIAEASANAAFVFFENCRLN